MFIFYCCLTNYCKLWGLNQYPFINSFPYRSKTLARPLAFLHMVSHGGKSRESHAEHLSKTSGVEFASGTLGCLSESNSLYTSVWETCFSHSFNYIQTTSYLLVGIPPEAVNRNLRNVEHAWLKSLKNTTNITFWIFVSF